MPVLEFRRDAAVAGWGSWWTTTALPCLRGEFSQPATLLIAVYIVMLIVFATSASISAALIMAIVSSVLLLFATVRAAALLRSVVREVDEAGARPPVRVRVRMPPGVTVAQLRMMFADRDFTADGAHRQAGAAREARRSPPPTSPRL